MSISPGQNLDEVAGLRRTMRDLVALSALAAVWTGSDSASIADSLADCLLKTLSLELVYVRIPSADVAGFFETIRWRDEAPRPQEARKIGQTLAPWLNNPFSPTAAIPHPRGQGTLHIAITRFGYCAGAGVLVAGSAQADFPSEQHRLLLTVGANQAAIAINNAELYRRAQTEIAERRRAEESERAARTQAERASRMRDEFLATVSHELRTPLNSVLGWTQLLRRAPHDRETLDQALEAIERGARSQMRLIEDLLDMSRIISGKLRLEVQTVDLAPLIQAAIDTVQPAVAAKEIRIDRVLDPQAVPVKGDPARLQQIFWNLLSNAVKFTAKGGKVQIHLQRVNSQVEICVSDTGRGIDPDFVPHVFDRFSQADSSTTRRHGGLGLGLAVVKHLVELHGGKVWASSPGEGQGATFTVHLPIAIVQQDAQGREHPVSPGSTEDDSLEVKLTDVRILVVDDDPDACEMLRRVLQDSQAKVSTAHSAQEALNIFPDVQPQIIISDIGMPEMDGYELIRRLRSHGKKIPAVAVTAFARSEDRIRALQAGYNLHVAKPLEPREIITVIAALVGSIPSQ